MSLPQPVRIDLHDSVARLWHDRVAQHTQDTYLGVPMPKFPEDLRVYEHLLWVGQVDVVIELGTWSGGGALWFRDRLRTLASYRGSKLATVVSVDVDLASAREHVARLDPASDGIVLLDGDVRDPDLPARVARYVPPGARIMVVEDSAHVYETTKAALEGFARFVAPGGFLVVEDGCVDVEDLRIAPDWPRGVLPAVREWLETDEGRDFAVDRDLELYGITCHPEGFLRRHS